MRDDKLVIGASAYGQAYFLFLTFLVFFAFLAFSALVAPVWLMKILWSPKDLGPPRGAVVMRLRRAGQQPAMPR